MGGARDLAISGGSRAWRRGIAIGAVAILLAIIGLYVAGRAQERPPGWGVSAKEWTAIGSGDWKRALEPLDSIPLEPNAAAEEVALRLSDRYCEAREVDKYEQHTTDHDYVMFVPACLEVDGPDTRLESHSADIQVEVGPVPILIIDGGRTCNVNAGGEYRGGHCVNLLKGVDIG